MKSESERMGEKRMEVCVPHFYYSDVTITLYSEYSKRGSVGVKSESERMEEKRMEVCVPHFYNSDVHYTSKLFVLSSKCINSEACLWIIIIPHSNT